MTVVAGVARAGTGTPTIRRVERFARVGSTNDIVRDWLAAGEPEVCVAIADEQTAGRGRNGRTWTAPAGAGLLLSLGFRPGWLPPDRVWQLAAVTSLAMAAAAAEVAGIAEGSIRLKWPNDLVVESEAGDEVLIRKLGGVLGETDGLGTDDPRAIVGIGLNTNWRAADLPADLAGSATSLQRLNGDRPIDPAVLFDGFCRRLEPAIGALHTGAFDARGWADRQVTTGREVDLARPDGTTERVRAIGVDGTTGALTVADAAGSDGVRAVFVGEIRRVRLAGM